LQPTTMTQSNYYWSNVQHYVERLLEDYIEASDHDRDEFVQHVIMHTRVRSLLRELVDDVLQASVTNNELMLAILNSCDWNEVFQHTMEYIYHNYPESMGS